ncbi:sodium-translocating pyrophosphatase [Persicimonas caeni]|uniref:Putative K(+)-stimulated pyrophosphate-energized sodium pump n=1 Tax=Persicimonas caeni TaxID=2292766 RepID=A0A4Y6PP29_PERCE|nr:sodium-translocating pyrophosphatase [Persicimonas caeni]QDG50088.1 sodium-translocating pyrophosphatase [Persicimonas caeni]QED31309.1 sodium-translocating pyrophosphatase [Persicimonas caeni]
METWIIYAILGSGLLALVYAIVQASWISKQEVGTARMDELAGYIREGAMAFLSKEYRVLSVFVIVVAGLLFFIYYNSVSTGALDAGGLGAVDMGLVAISFVVGAICSAAAGFFGMRVATNANVRTTNAARKGLAPGLKISFAGGAVMGMSVVGLALLGLSVLLIFFSNYFNVSLVEAIASPEQQLSYKGLLNVVTGFSLGASSIALFARVGGGIYTKAADVGGDLVGKVEAGLAEDDPRNPAAIADAVGDNVGDVAGMGADLFESYVGSIIGAMVLALGWAATLAASGAENPNGPIFLPLVIAAVGIVISIACTFLVRTKEDGNPSRALHTGTISAAVLTAIATFFLVKWAMPEGGIPGTEYGQLGPFWAVVGGLTAGTLIGLVTEYYTSDHYKPVQEIAAESEMGTAPNIIAGLGVGMISTGIPVVLIVIAIAVAYYFSGLYGIALAALGMLATTGIQLAVDAFGPIADNAGGIAEMAELPSEVRDRTDKLDSVGNTTAAIGKGFAIGSAALTSLALFTAFTQQAGIDPETGINVLNPQVMIGVFIGAIMPFLFSALAMKAVGRSASAMIEEVRRQFREIDGLLEGKAKADYTRCVDISTGAALKEMIAPGLLAIVVAVAAGFWSPIVLGGVLVGVTTAGVAMAIYQSNAGGAWDNAKKYIESGKHGGKNSPAHKASVVGDTVGDPFKDTAGPSLNILLKLMSVTALVLAPVIAIPAATEISEGEATEPAAQMAKAEVSDDRAEEGGAEARENVD